MKKKLQLSHHNGIINEVKLRIFRNNKIKEDEESENERSLINQEEEDKVMACESENTKEEICSTEVDGEDMQIEVDRIYKERLIDNEDNDLTLEQRKKILRRYPYFKIDVVMISGRNLLAMDRRGTSDPYVKCVQGSEKLFQTKYVLKTVNPQWNETFICHTDNPFKPLVFEVYDHDVVGSDEFMGEATIEMTDVQLKRCLEFTIPLKDGENEDLIRKNKKRKPLGSISFNLTIIPLTKEDMNEHIIALSCSSPPMTGSNLTVPLVNNANTGDGLRYRSWVKATKRPDGLAESNLQILRAEKTGKCGKTLATATSIVHVVIVQARDLEITPESGDAVDPYCKLALGKEKFKTKSMISTINPKWREWFDFFWYDDADNDLEITIWHNNTGSKDNFLGRAWIDLKEFEKERTYNIWREIKDGSGRLHLIVTISSTTQIDSPSNLINWEEEFDNLKNIWNAKYRWKSTFNNIKDVGHCLVKVLRAQGLSGPYMGGKPDTFCTIELGNEFFMTQTEYKTSTPSWQKVFHFEVKDVHDVIEVTIYDEQKDHKYEFLGKIAIPLLRIRNNERRWYAFKDKKLRIPARGENAQVLLEIYFVYNKIRASIRTIKPKQIKYTDKSDIKFKHTVFMRNFNRVKSVSTNLNPEILIVELKKILCWENRLKSSAAFFAFEIFVYYFEIWMLPLTLLIPILKNVMILSITGGWNPGAEDEYDDDEEEDFSGLQSINTGISEGDKKTLKEKMQSIQDITLMVQNGLGALAHILESVGNVFNFSVPFLTWLLCVLLCIVAILLYYVPFRYIVMAWGAHKFSKKLIKPEALDNNEFVDFISRVPDNEMLKNYRELPTTENKERKRLTAKKALSLDSDII